MLTQDPYSEKTDCNEISIQFKKKNTGIFTDNSLNIEEHHETHQGTIIYFRFLGYFHYVLKARILCKPKTLLMRFKLKFKAFEEFIFCGSKNNYVHLFECCVSVSLFDKVY